MVNERALLPGRTRREYLTSNYTPGKFTPEINKKNTIHN